MNNAASILRIGFVALLIAGGLSLACKVATPAKSVEVAPAPSVATVCQLGHSC